MKKDNCTTVTWGPALSWKKKSKVEKREPSLKKEKPNCTFVTRGPPPLSQSWIGHRLASRLLKATYSQFPIPSFARGGASKEVYGVNVVRALASWKAFWSSSCVCCVGVFHKFLPQPKCTNPGVYGAAQKKRTWKARSKPKGQVGGEPKAQSHYANLTTPKWNSTLFYQERRRGKQVRISLYEWK